MHNVFLDGHLHLESFCRFDTGRNLAWRTRKERGGGLSFLQFLLEEFGSCWEARSRYAGSYLRQCVDWKSGYKKEPAAHGSSKRNMVMGGGDDLSRIELVESGFQMCIFAPCVGTL